ncbi:MAG: radical SAM protein [Spirochaetes bacterium]|nr:radical SAM protein [Spirochaetota bacterium]
MLRIHNFLPISEVNGPGKRSVIWTQGCLKECVNCFNYIMKDISGGYIIHIEALYEKIISNKEIEGISISGGEPFLQAAEIYKLLEKIRFDSNLSILVYTGMTMEEILLEQNIKKNLDFIDVLVAGPYIDKLKKSGSIISSSNQNIHLLTDRYSIEDFNWPESEITITHNGMIIITGTKPVAMD